MYSRTIFFDNYVFRIDFVALTSTLANISLYSLQFLFRSLRLQVESLFDADGDQEAIAWWSKEKERLLSGSGEYAQLKGLRGYEKEQKMKEILKVQMEKLYDLDKSDVVRCTSNTVHAQMTITMASILLKTKSSLLLSLANVVLIRRFRCCMLMVLFLYIYHLALLLT